MSNLIEILYKVRPGDPESIDGRIIDWAPAGQFFTAQEMTDWFNGTEPTAKLNALQESKRSELLVVVRSHIALIAPSVDPEAVGLLRYPKRSEAERLALAQKAVADAVRWADIWRTEGVDTNWGRKSLMLQGIAIADIPVAELKDMFQPPADLNQDPLDRPSLAPVPEWRVPYESLLSGRSRTDLEDKDKRVVPARHRAPWSKGQLAKFAGVHDLPKDFLGG